MTPVTQTRQITVNLSDDAAERYDAAITGGDDDVLLRVEKAIVTRLYPHVDSDVDLVAVERFGKPLYVEES